MTNKTIQVIEKLKKFLDPYMSLANCHMVDFFTKSLFKHYIPENIQHEISTIGHEIVTESLLSDTPLPETPCLNEFVSTAKSLSLYNLSEVCITLQEFKKVLSANEAGLRLNVFMKAKKAHEVETLSSIAASVARVTKTSHLIDIGDGRGYLSSLLAFHHKLPVLGIDASLVNTTSAIKRAEKLEKYWLGIAKIPKDPVHELEFKNNANLYKQVTQFVTAETDFDQLINNVFLEKSSGIGLVGLHTCGNLGPSSIRIFNANNNIKSICNVSCCYHLLNENYITNSIKWRGNSDGFPMSDFYKSKNYVLSRASLMLAAQSMDRVLAEKIIPSKVIFYRAVFENIAQKYCKDPREKNVRKFRHQPKNFVDYSREAIKRVDIAADISDEELRELYANYEGRQKELITFHLIRSMLAPVIEALVLLDRYLYLLEQGHCNAYLVQLFDPVISPRCYGLIAYR